MPDTQKILAEFNELVDKLWDKYGESYEVYDPKEFTREIESFLSFKIQQAVAEGVKEERNAILKDIIEKGGFIGVQQGKEYNCEVVCRPVLKE